MIVAEITAVFKANTAQFTSGVAKAEVETKAFGKTAGTGTVKNLALMESRMDKAGLASTGMGKRLYSLQAILGQTGKGFLGMSTTGTIATVAIATAVVMFAFKAVKAYNAHNVALLQLQGAIKRSPFLIGATAKAFDDQARAIGDATGASRDEILAADTMLARFKLTQSQIMTLNPLIVDYARATGKDIPTAAGLLGRAMLGNARALKLVGINFKATGDTAKDFNTITTALAAKVGGTSAIYAKTLPGALAILGEKFHNFAIDAGKYVVPVLTELTKGATVLLPAVASLIPGLLILAGAFLAFKAVSFLPPLLALISQRLAFVGTGTLAANIGGMASSVGVLSTSLVGLSGFLGALTSPLGLAAVGVFALTTAMSENRAAARRMAAGVSEVAASITSGLNPAVAVQQAYAAEKNVPKKSIGDFWQQIAHLNVNYAKDQNKALLLQIETQAADTQSAINRMIYKTLNRPNLNAMARGGQDFAGQVIGLTGVSAAMKQQLAQNIAALDSYGVVLSKTSLITFNNAISANDFTTALNLTQDALDKYTQSWDKAAGIGAGFSSSVKDQMSILRSFAMVSGQSFSDFRAAALAAYQTTQAAQDQVSKGIKPPTGALEAWTNFLKTTRDAEEKWRSTVASGLNFVAGDLQTLAGKSHLTAGEILKDFQKQLAAMGSYGANWRKVAAMGGAAAGDFLKAIADMGQQGAPLLAALARGNKKQIEAIVGTWNKAEGKSQSLADVIKNDLIPAIEKLSSAFSGIPASKTITFTVKDAQAMAALNALNQKIADTAGGTAFLFPTPVKSQAGGIVGGVGRGDHVPALLEPGEFVMRRAAVQREGVGRMSAVNAGTAHFAAGGPVGTTAPMSGDLDAVSERVAAAIMQGLREHQTVLEIDGHEILVAVRRVKNRRPGSIHTPVI